LDETFDGIGLRVARSCVDCAVDHAVAANTKNFDEFQSIIVDKRAKRRWSGGVGF
jgi:hypothetical protein